MDNPRQIDYAKDAANSNKNLRYITEIWEIKSANGDYWLRCLDEQEKSSKVTTSQFGAYLIKEPISARTRP